MAAKTKPLPANVVTKQQQYADLGLANATSYTTANALDAALVKEVYRLDPAKYTGKNGVVNVAGAKTEYDFQQPKLSKPATEPASFTQAVNNYANAIRTLQTIGADNVNKTDLATLNSAARSVRDFDSKDLSENAKLIISNVGNAVDAINAINNKRQEIQRKQNLIDGKDAQGNKLPSGQRVNKAAERANLTNLENEYQRLVNTANQDAPKLEESLARFGLSDIARGIGQPIAQAAKVDTGLEALRGERLFGVGTGTFGGRLNSQITDEQILGDINTARRNEYKSLYDIGTAAVTDLQSQLSTAQAFLADLPTGDRRRTDAQKTIDNITKELSDAQADTLEARNLYENYQPVSGTQAQTAISSFRESLRLPEERTLQQIETIDPEISRTVRALSSQYGQMAAQPIGPTTTPQTEELRQTIEQEALNQLRLGSTIGAEERRGYEQAIRAAQTARGNIAGLGPAVQEAASIGAAGEQRKLARYGAATQFLGSGETTGAALARDLGFRNALEQSRLGAAAGFVAGGPSMYNLASQRLGQQQAALGQYLAAAQPQQTPGFQATPSQFNPYAYVNPNAGFIGAQNAAQIYNTLADYQAQTYGAQTSAIASSYRSPFQNAGSLLSGISGFSGMFGGPGSNAFFRA
jgi:uncharacterized protein YdbL (DUF1318 family)